MTKCPQPKTRNKTSKKKFTDSSAIRIWSYLNTKTTSPTPTWLICRPLMLTQKKRYSTHCTCNFNVDCSRDNSVSIWHEFGRVSPKSHGICLKEFLLTCCTSASVYFAPSFFSLSLPFPDSSGCCQLELGSLPGVGVPTLSRGSARLHLMGRRTIRIIVLFLADWVQSSRPQFSCFGYNSTKDTSSTKHSAANFGVLV